MAGDYLDDRLPPPQSCRFWCILTWHSDILFPVAIKKTVVPHLCLSICTCSTARKFVKGFEKQRCRGERGTQRENAVKEAKPSEPTVNRLDFSLWLQFDSYSHKKHHQPARSHLQVLLVSVVVWLHKRNQAVVLFFFCIALSSVCAECHITVPHYKEISHPPLCSPSSLPPVSVSNSQFPILLQCTWQRNV